MNEDRINEGKYPRQSFYSTLAAVREGTRRFEVLLTHDTFIHRARQICAHYAPKQSEDAYQELCTRVFLSLRRKKLDRVDSEEAFFKWASKVVRNISIDMYRASNKLGEQDDAPVEDHIIRDTATPSPYFEQAVREWFESLSPLQQLEIQILIENPSISTREISELLDQQGCRRSHTAVANDLKETRKSLLETVEKGKEQRPRASENSKPLSAREAWDKTPTKSRSVKC